MGVGRSVGRPVGRSVGRVLRGGCVRPGDGYENHRPPHPPPLTPLSHRVLLPLSPPPPRPLTPSIHPRQGLEYHVKHLAGLRRKLAVSRQKDPAVSFFSPPLPSPPHPPTHPPTPRAAIDRSSLRTTTRYPSPNPDDDDDDDINETMILRFVVIIPPRPPPFFFSPAFGIISLSHPTPALSISLSRTHPRI